eukprot:989905-Ditylum_brightwellii.AAC.1
MTMYCCYCQSRYCALSTLSSTSSSSPSQHGCIIKKDMKVRCCGVAMLSLLEILYCLAALHCPYSTMDT